jgi:signal transduction histidine kinase
LATILFASASFGGGCSAGVYQQIEKNMQKSSHGYPKNPRPNPLSMDFSPAKNKTPITMYRIILGLATARILTPIRDPSIRPTMEGTAIRGMTHPRFMYIQAADVSVMDSKNLLVATDTFRGTPIRRLRTGMFAHEINNPLALINETAGYVKDQFTIKKQYNKDDELLENIDYILDAVERCGTITRQLLGFARKFDVKIQKVNLNEIISDLLVFYKKEAEYRNVNVYVDIAEDIPEIETDRGKLQQVLLNLVNNAFQALDNGCNLDIKASPESRDRVSITISDNGCGMSQENLSKIFEPFFTTKEKGQGTGLGLAITYALVKKLQ